ncbi:MAG: hypothetical protein IJW66_00960 [Clostridia bacterium]|nr:hypothetical protein [Clostridia bacterium]
MSSLLIKNENSAVRETLSALPARLRREIERLALGRALSLSGIREIRLRRDAACAMLYDNDFIPLSRISEEELSGVVDRLCEGCLFAHRDTISLGYLSLPHGVRVGVAGRCRYEAGELVGVSDISGLVFRLPCGRCEFGEELYSLYREHKPRGMLIYSPPGVGKTTALKYLAGRLGSGRGAVSVVVVDERCEFLHEDYENSRVDILRGYRKRLGIEIAVRTLSAECVIADELGADDVESVLDVMRFGVPFIASAHAGSAEELLKKPSMRPLFEAGAIDMLVGISREGKKYSLSRELLD